MMIAAEMVARMLDEGRKHPNKDPLVITPCPRIDDLKDSGAASVDVRLGTWFLTLRQARLTHLRVRHKLRNRG